MRSNKSKTPYTDKFGIDQSSEIIDAIFYESNWSISSDNRLLTKYSALEIVVYNANVALLTHLLNDKEIDPSMFDNELLIWIKKRNFPDILKHVMLSLLTKDIRVKTTSIKLNQNFHNDEDKYFIRKNYPELLI